MNDYERGEWDMFVMLSSAWYGKQAYFLQDVDATPFGIVYSRIDHKYMTRPGAYADFAKKIGDDGSL